MSEIIYSNVTFKKHMNKDAVAHGEMSKASTEHEEDVTYSDIRTGVKEEVKAEKERDACCDDPSLPVGSKVVTPERERQKVALITLMCVCVILLIVIILAVLCISNFAKMNDTLTVQQIQLTSELQQVKWNLSLVSDLLATAKGKQCSSGWEFFNESCYYFSKDKLTWEQSHYACIHDGGHLVIIQSQQEQDFIRKKVGKTDDKNSYWIGMRDTREEGVWVWIDNTTLNETNKYWDQHKGTNTPAEPNNWPPGEDCAQIGLRCLDQINCWFDFACERNSKRICEHRATDGPTLNNITQGP
ncbi:hypothetical protein UPYG_G00237470 [Umbra pygmaea]|uniref:C-type lectin domain-containing protein n=1 Tax=Umbra pygmaea TaxID=75934 RepID=A0ABD0X0T1_UMBPY